MSCETYSIIVFYSNRSKLINKPDVNNKMKWYVLHATTDQNNQKSKYLGFSNLYIPVTIKRN